MQLREAFSLNKFTQYLVRQVELTLNWIWIRVGSHYHTVMTIWAPNTKTVALSFCFHANWCITVSCSALATVNQSGSDCPFALKMVACNLLLEITTFLRETFQYLPKSKSFRREMSVWDKPETSRRWSSILGSPVNSDRSNSKSSQGEAGSHSAGKKGIYTRKQLKFKKSLKSCKNSIDTKSCYLLCGFDAWLSDKVMLIIMGKTVMSRMTVSMMRWGVDLSLYLCRHLVLTNSSQWAIITYTSASLQRTSV